jgi:hypothetical protein
MEGRTSMSYGLVYFRWEAGHPCPMDGHILPFFFLQGVGYCIQTKMFLIFISLNSIVVN